VNETIVGLGNRVKKEISSLADKVSASPYAKADASITLGARWAFESKKNTGIDINRASVTVVKVGAEVDRKGISPEYRNGSSNRENSSGVSYGQQVGVIPVAGIPVPVSTSSGFSNKTQYENGQVESTSREQSASVAVTGVPLGAFASHESKIDDSGTTHTIRLSPFTTGHTIGAGGVFEWSASFGIKVTFGNDD
jgi:hypothetical protein